IDRDKGTRPAGHGLIGDRRSEVARRDEPDGQSLDPGLELAGVERLGHYVVGTRFQEADALLDIVSLADAQNGDRGEGALGAQVPADVGGIRGGVWYVGNEQRVVG